MAAPLLVDIASLIEATPGVNGGRPCLAGTALSVRQLAILQREGLSAEAILAEYPHLDLARVYAGLAYYLANKAAFDAELDAERGEHNGPGFRGSEA